MDDKTILALLEQNQKMISILEKNQKQSDLLMKAVATSNEATLFHGPDGLLNDAKIERDVISTIIRPTGLLSVLPLFATNNEEAFFAALTGYNESAGDEPDEPCDDAPSGLYKACKIKTTFGKIQRATKTIDAIEIVKKANRGDTTDLRLLGNWIGDLGALGNPGVGGIDPSTFMQLTVRSELVGAATAIQRKFTGMLWTGDPANNTVGGGYKEFVSLDSQISTTIVDADTGAACPSLYSQVYDHTFGDIDTTLITEMRDVESYLQTLAQDTGLADLNMVIVMHPMLWYKLSEVWVQNYNTNLLVPPANDIPAQESWMNGQIRQELDRMRRLRQIELNGNVYTVVVDSSIPLLSNATNPVDLPLTTDYASSIYFIPLSIAGGFPVTYVEYADYSGLGTTFAAMMGKNMFWTDNGRYIWSVQQEKTCFKFQGVFEPRVVLRTPQFAAKFTDVKFSTTRLYRAYSPDQPGYVNA